MRQKQYCNQQFSLTNFDKKRRTSKNLTLLNCAIFPFSLASLRFISIFLKTNLTVMQNDMQRINRPNFTQHDYFLATLQSVNGIIPPFIKMGINRTI